MDDGPGSVAALLSKNVWAMPNRFTIGMSLRHSTYFELMYQTDHFTSMMYDYKTLQGKTSRLTNPSNGASPPLVLLSTCLPTGHRALILLSIRAPPNHHGVHPQTRRVRHRPTHSPDAAAAARLQPSRACTKAGTLDSLRRGTGKGLELKSNRCRVCSSRAELGQGRE